MRRVPLGDLQLRRVLAEHGADGACRHLVAAHEPGVDPRPGRDRGPDLVRAGRDLGLVVLRELVTHQDLRSLRRFGVGPGRGARVRPGRDAGMDGDDEMVLASPVGLLVVVLRYQRGHRLHQLGGEGGPVGGGSESHRAVHGERRELALRPGRTGDQVTDVADELRGQREQPAGGQAVRRAGRVGRDGRQRGRRDHVGGRGRLQQPLGHVALAPLLDQFHQPVLLQRAQVIVDLLPGKADHRRPAWPPTAARSAGPAAALALVPARLPPPPRYRSLPRRSWTQSGIRQLFLSRKFFLSVVFMWQRGFHSVRQRGVGREWRGAGLGGGEGGAAG